MPSTESSSTLPALRRRRCARQNVRFGRAPASLQRNTHDVVDPRTPDVNISKHGRQMARFDSGNPTLDQEVDITMFCQQSQQNVSITQTQERDCCAQHPPFRVEVMHTCARGPHPRQFLIKVPHHMVKILVEGIFIVNEKRRKAFMDALPSDLIGRKDKRFQINESKNGPLQTIIQRCARTHFGLSVVKCIQVQPLGVRLWVILLKHGHGP